MKKVGIMVMGGVLVLAVVLVMIYNQSKETGEGERKAAQNSEPVEQQGKFEEKDEPDEKATASKTDRPLVSSELIGGNGGEEEAREMMSRLRGSIGKKNEAKAARLIAKLVKDLNLTPEQKEELERYFAEQLELAQGVFSGESDADDPMAGARAMAALDGKELDEVMEGLLTPEQQEKWAEREEKRVHRVADSAALKELSKISSVLDVREDQRDAVYDHFYQKSQESENGDSRGGVIGSALGAFTEGLGLEMNFDSVLGSDFGAVIAEASAEGGEVDVPALLRRQRESQIENEVRELEPILDEGQLQNYREHLESQGSLFDGIIGGAGQSSIQVVPSAVVPIE